MELLKYVYFYAQKSIIKAGNNKFQDLINVPRMKAFAKFDEIPSMTQDIKETKRHGHTFVRSFVRSDGQRENSIPSHKHSLQGYKDQELKQSEPKSSPQNQNEK